MSFYGQKEKGLPHRLRPEQVLLETWQTFVTPSRREIARTDLRGTTGIQLSVQNSKLQFDADTETSVFADTLEDRHQQTTKEDILRLFAMIIPAIPKSTRVMKDTQRSTVTIR